MRPTKLQIEGFNSFRQLAELDFSELDLFAITGPTGAGKTSIIDAMVYALYGHTPRIGDKSITELISQGSERVRVFFQFEVSGKTYRLVRTLKRGGATKVSLELQKGTADDWEPLSNKVSEVRDQVQQIVGLDFDGFTKSVVLPQGQFDQFLRGKADERRHIITELLRLDVYVEMGRRARQISDEADREINLTQQHLAEAYGDITEERQALLADELKANSTRQEALRKEIEALRLLRPKALDLRRNRQDWSQASSELEKLEQKLTDAKADRESAEDGLKQCEERLRKAEVSLAAVGFDQKRYEKLLTFVQIGRQVVGVRRKVGRLESELGDVLSDVERLGQATLNCRERWDGTRKVLESAEKDCAKAKTSLADTKKRHGSAESIESVIEDLDGLADNRKSLAELQEGIGQREKELEGTRARLQDCEKQEETARDKVRQADAELDAMRRLHAVDEVRRTLRKGAPCPVCEQTVTAVPAAGKHAAVDKLKEALQGAKDRHQRARDSLTRLREKLESLPEMIKADRASARAAAKTIESVEEKVQRTLADRVGPHPARQLQALLKEMQQLEQALEQAEERLENAEQQESRAASDLRDHEHEVDLKEQKRDGIKLQLDSATRELKDLIAQLPARSNPEQLQDELSEQEKAKEKADELEALKRKDERLQVNLQRQLTGAKSKMETVSEERDSHRKKVDQLQKDITATERRLRKELGSGEKSKIDESAEVEKRHTIADGDLQALVARCAVLEADLARMKKGLQERAAKEERVTSLIERRSLYKELGAALQANQFIRYIQEEVLQRLAEDGTTHLLKLSSGRYSFGTRDNDFLVLDHWNADEPRSVNTLSGGESFLASLALALALGDTVTDFAFGGANVPRLDSLFLDEGFSTLDPETLDVVVQGVEALGEGDRLVGVISHIPELAERFPAQVEVVKALGGSSLRVSKGTPQPSLVSPEAPKRARATASRSK